MSGQEPVFTAPSASPKAAAGGLLRFDPRWVRRWGQGAAIAATLTVALCAGALLIDLPLRTGGAAPSQSVLAIQNTLAVGDLAVALWFWGLIMLAGASRPRRVWAAWFASLVMTAIAVAAAAVAIGPDVPAGGWPGWRWALSLFAAWALGGAVGLLIFGALRGRPKWRAPLFGLLAAHWTEVIVFGAVGGQWGLRLTEGPSFPPSAQAGAALIWSAIMSLVSLCVLRVVAPRQFSPGFLKR